MNRKKKLRVIQLSLLLLGVFFLVFTYTDRRSLDDKIISTEKREEIKKQLTKENQDGDIFFNIEYSGLDLAGNRFVLKSEEALTNKSNPEKVEMKFVKANFFFKDDTILLVESERGVYNNKTLDMNFMGNVRAQYEGSKLFAQKAEYSNSESYLIISENVKIKDVKGSIFADKLFFDIKKQTLDIASFKDDKINANINLK